LLEHGIFEVENDIFDIGNCESLKRYRWSNWTIL